MPYVTSGLAWGSHGAGVALASAPSARFPPAPGDVGGG